MLMLLPACGSAQTGAKQMEYVASTPCNTGSKPIPGIPNSATCELILWNLKLNLETAGKPSTFELHCSYGTPQNGTKGLTGGGTKLEFRGSFSMTVDRSGRTMYTLEPQGVPGKIYLVKLNDRLLHLLDSDHRLMIGTGAWSYTLNRIDHQ